MKKCHLILLGIYFLTTTGLAQESIDLFTVSGRLGLPSSYNPELENKAQESGGLINLRIPVVFSEKTIWFNNLTYGHYQVSNGMTFNDSIYNPIQVHGFILQTGLVQRIDDDNAFQLLFVPRYMSDMANSSSGAWQFGAIALYEHTFNENLTLRFGAMYNREKAGPLLVPLVDVNWKISERWSLTGLLPIYGKLNYKVNDRFVTGISHFGLITSYELTAEPYAGNYMERTSIDLTLFGRWKAFGNWHIEGRLGYSLDRNYEQYTSDQTIDLRVSILKFGDNRGNPINPVFNDGPIANLRIVYNLPLE